MIRPIWPPHAEDTPVTSGVSLLWALRSPCNLGCKYCYFGTIEEHREQPPGELGVLSHLSRADLSLADVAAFVQTLSDSRVSRIFLAGGEPLIWPPILDVIELIKAAGVEVVVCTNGIPLNRPAIVERLLTCGVDAVSVSLDSPDAGYNDTWRPARNGHDGHKEVISGVRALLDARGGQPAPRVGLYMVVTRRNIDAIKGVADLAVELGCDYFVPQPIALDADHALFRELSLTPTDAPAVYAAMNALYAHPRLPIALPERRYPDLVMQALASELPSEVRGCFGGADLFFIEPDGSVWDCPSSLKIAATGAAGQRSIRGARAADLFGAAGTTRACQDCALFSRDCVNMWPLVGFDAFQTPAGAGR